MRLTPAINRRVPLELACEVARWSARFKERGIAGLGLGELEADHPRAVRTGVRNRIGAGLGRIPHAGEVAGPATIPGAIGVISADRMCHGMRHCHR